MSMMDEIPGSLRRVADVFRVFGLLAAADVLLSLPQGRLSFNFGVLGLWIAPGLLRLSPGWRTCGLVLLWVAMIGSGIAAVFVANHSGELPFVFFGQRVGRVPGEVAVLVPAAIFAVSLWQYRVLTRPEIGRLFEAAEG